MTRRSPGAGLTKPPGRPLAGRPRPSSSLALFADIRDSRRFEGAARATLQQRFTALVRRLNTRFAQDVLAPFQISRGDELQGLIQNPGVVPEIIWHLELWFREADLYVGLGFGRIDTPVRGSVLEMDGPALHRARAAIEAAAAEARFGGVFLGFGPLEDDLVNGLARLLRRQREGWSERQRQVVALLREGLTQTAIAAKLALTKQAISAHARAAGWNSYAEGERAFVEGLAGFATPTPGSRT